MTALPDLCASDFPAFFKAVHGPSPFPWQRRLADRLSAGGGWPAVLDLPTGTGKTAAIDIAVFQLALEAGASRRAAPLRIVYVVDRRTIVDQAHQRAVVLREAIEDATDGVLAAVRTRLASYGRAKTPLVTALLRGGIARDNVWARSPDQPVVAVSTVDQVGSRLLFRGYGVSDSMKPIHAGLLGNDVLYLLDEVHLSQPFRQTLTAISTRYRDWAQTRIESTFAVVEMSATPGEPREDSFHLDDDDRGHPVLAQRLESAKLTTLDSTTGRNFVATIENAVKPLIRRDGATVAVVVNRVAGARDLHRRLATVIKSADVVLITGRMRPLDRDRLESALIPRIAAGRTRDPDARAVLIVATQCIEAGADFDFDALVTECASLDALRQRFGRLDRLGALRGEGRGVVIARTDTLKDDPVYGDALGATWAWLSEQAEISGQGGTVDFGIDGLRVPRDAAERGLLAPRPSAPVLLPSHLDAWVQTSPMPTPDPDVSLWLHGPERGAADVQIVWRGDLSEALMTACAPGEPNEARATEVAIATVEALPPSSGEAMSVPFVAVKRWLKGQSEAAIADVEGARDINNKDAWKEAEPRARCALVWRGENSEVAEASGLRPGDTIVVPSSYGGVANGSWAPDCEDEVSDLAEMAALHMRGRATLRLQKHIVANLFGPAVPDPPTPTTLEVDVLEDRSLVRAWLVQVSQRDIADPDAALLIARLAGETKSGLRIERLPLGLDGEFFLVSSSRRKSTSGQVSTEDDRASFTGVGVPLIEHLRGVRDVAGEFADRSAPSREVASDVRLAGHWHDIGKIDPRFQRLLYGGSEYKTLVATEPLAKSAVDLNDVRKRREALSRSKYPRGTRHELMSLALMNDALPELSDRAADWDLVRHLVASHHGRCRPLAPWVEDPEPVEMEWMLDGVQVGGSSAHALAKLDSGIAERFWLLTRRYGWWGLAWLETVLRLGDHRRSEEEQRGEPR